jgi:DNA-directed RNA polymerase subunit delta
MSSITDRTSYLRGLAQGLNLDKEKNENRLVLEMLAVMDEMAQKLKDLEDDVDELDEYVESIDGDLGDIEDALFGDDEEDFDEDEADDEEPEEFDEDEELSFDCPHCGKTIQIKAADIDFDESPICPNCKKPFFPDVIEGEDSEDGEKGE